MMTHQDRAYVAELIPALLKEAAMWASSADQAEVGARHRGPLAAARARQQAEELERRWSESALRELESRAQAQKKRYAAHPVEGAAVKRRRYLGSARRARVSAQRVLPREAARAARREGAKAVAAGGAAVGGTAAGGAAALLGKDLLKKMIARRTRRGPSPWILLPAAAGGLVAGNVALRELGARTHGGYRKKKSQR